MWVFGIGQNNISDSFSEVSYSKFHKDKKSNELYKVSHTNFEESDVIIIESESEIETDIIGLVLKIHLIILIYRSKKRKFNFTNFQNFIQKTQFHYMIYFACGNFICLNQ